MWQLLKRTNLSQWILVAMVMGLLLGLFLPAISVHLNVVFYTGGGNSRAL